MSTFPKEHPKDARLLSAKYFDSGRLLDPVIHCSVSDAI